MAGMHPVFHETAVKAFKGNILGALVHPADHSYNAARRVRDGLIDRRPAMIAYCTGVADVIAAAQFTCAHDLIMAVSAKEHADLFWAVRGGGNFGIVTSFAYRVAGRGHTRP
jgi:hypothetical protein